MKLFIFLTFLTVFSSLYGEDPTVAVKAKVVPEAIRVSEFAELQVEVIPPEGYHLYAMEPVAGGPKPLKFSLPAEVEMTHSWFGTPPLEEYDENFKKKVLFYDLPVTFSTVIKFSQVANEPLLTVTGQICNPKRCFSFKTAKPLTVSFEEGEPREEFKDAPELSGIALNQNAKTPFDGGLLSLLILAFLAGLGALLTPCVFPMIPITVSFFSKFSKVSIGRALLMASVYAGSIIATFTFIGIAVSAIFGAVGMQALSSSPWFNLFLAVLLVVFAFNLFGYFEISIPSWMIAGASKKEQKLTSGDGSLSQQTLGVFLMAITFTLVSFSCTVGFIGIVIAEAAKGNWFYPAVGMLSFSLAFSIPFFFLALFPSWADKLKGKGGDWMIAVKAVLGFLELAGAFKFISNVDLVWRWEIISRPFVLIIWMGIFAVMALFLLRVFNLPFSDESNKVVGPFRLTTALLAVSIVIYLGTVVGTSKSLGGWIDGWLPPIDYLQDGAESKNVSDENLLNWIKDDIPLAMKRAREENKPLFVDFTGYTCTNCRFMESSMFPKPAISRELAKMVLLKAYTDGESEVNQAQRLYQISRFQTAALPFYAIIDPFTDTVIAVHPDMTNNENSFLEFLVNGIAGYGSSEKKAEEAPEKKSEIDFSFKTIDGSKNVSLSSFEGKWVLLNFWASWCAPCREELLNLFPKVLKNFERIQFLTVAFDGGESAAEARKFIKTVKIPGAVNLLGPADFEEADLSKEYQFEGSLPATYLINPEGKIVWMQFDAVSEKELVSELQKTR
ncbi:MAG: cytochrome c biogenesis protein CcdA [bacterium]